MSLSISRMEMPGGLGADSPQRKRHGLAELAMTIRRRTCSFSTRERDDPPAEGDDGELLARHAHDRRVVATFTFEDARGMYRGALTVGGLTDAVRREDSSWWYLGSARFTSEQAVSGRNAAWSVMLHRFGEMALA